MVPSALEVDEHVPDDLSAFLLGHIPEGMSAKYALRRMLLDGPMLRERQAEISAHIVLLLGSDPTLGMAPRSERGQASVKARKWKSCSRRIRETKA